MRPVWSAYPVEGGQAPEKKHQRPEGTQDGLQFWLARPSEEAAEPDWCSQQGQAHGDCDDGVDDEGGASDGGKRLVHVVPPWFRRLRRRVGFARPRMKEGSLPTKSAFTADAVFGS